MRKKLASTAGLSAFTLVLLVSGCSLKPLFDGTYTTVQPDLGYVMKGDNAALNAKVYVSSSLENNTGTMPNGETYAEYARWAGWWTSCLNDGVTTMALEGQGPLAWSSAEASPADNLPSWIVYDFGQQIEYTAVGLWPRSNASTGIGSNAPRNYILQYYTGRNELTKEDFASPPDAGLWTNIIPPVVQPDSWPSELGVETLHEFAPVKSRYFRLWITKAGGDFIQLVELAVYKTATE